jgi:hypothetical protein
MLLRWSYNAPSIYDSGASIMRLWLHVLSICALLMRRCEHHYGSVSRARCRSISAGMTNNFSEKGALLCQLKRVVLIELPTQFD